MTHELNFFVDSRYVRKRNLDAMDAAKVLLEAEQELIDQLVEIDRRKFYVRLGYKSLTGYCVKVLELSRTQTQRIVTAVRRTEPTFTMRIGDISGLDLGRRQNPIPVEIQQNRLAAAQAEALKKRRR